ncbi:fungal-specific transcription factor domain-domain-containing protein [Kockovaella imperatae]|uniref:Fungal-specific transcription factor domain-domain-containing protein n=1 Tax=Kockovaella imperatae TaxID=4999 RepID=A0A1Y1UG25_9TREE|nr:fungal-specific transcription factor domain-domain-containing protein [Kockovaella imperatae]ORX36464.1 fungal-specific transcription factor domain-domain-containing protein [Kockovaella imperatae]
MTVPDKQPSHSIQLPTKRRQTPDDHPDMTKRVDQGSFDTQSLTGESSSKKKRISLSCAQCESKALHPLCTDYADVLFPGAKRKQKCNREFPCQHCIARKVPELCVPYNPQSRRDSSVDGPDANTAARLDRIEDILSVVLRHHGGLWTYKDVKQYMSGGPYTRIFPSAPSSPSSPRRRSLAIAAENSASPIRHSALASTPINYDDHTHENEDGGSADEEDLGKGVSKGWLGDLEGGVPESLDAKNRVKIKRDVHGTPAENLQRLITDCGVSPHKIAELVQELPPKHFADRIVDSFFSGFNNVRYPIDEHLFRTSYEDLYNTSKAVDPSNVRALPLIFIVLALGVRLATGDWAGPEETRKLSSLRMYWSSRRSILIATAVQSESIELVSAMYLVLVHDRRLTECWSQLGASLRTAQAIGLHRDGTKMGLDPFETEYRRRLWSYLYHADKLYSLVLGRPPSISDSYTDTLDPTNVDLSEFHKLSAKNVPIAKPLEQPTSATFIILRKSLSKIIGHVVHHFQKLDEPARYSDVQMLNQELNDYVESLPPCFQMYQPDKSYDKEHPWLPVHRMLLLAEILVTIIILHRPWLLRRLSTSHYAASRTACFEAAKLDFQLRQEFQKEYAGDKAQFLTGQFKTFNTAMIAGISAIIDPRGPDGDQMRTILTTFLEQNPWHEAVHKDATTRKEVQIILTLSRRAAQIYEKSFGPDEGRNPEDDSAAMLLALSQPSDMPDELQSKGTSATTNQEKTSLGALPPQRVSSVPTAITALPINPSPIQISPTTHSMGEDDHSQRLFDHWLNANSTLAFGSLNESVPIFDDSAMGAALDGNTIPTSIMTTPYTQAVDSISSMFAATPVMTGPTGPASQQAFWTDSYSSFPGSRQVPIQSSTPLMETATGFDPSASSASFGVPQTGENSDEYWNALIDGEIQDCERART